MRRFDIGKMVLAVGSLMIGMAAAPAAPSYFGVERSIDEIHKAWSQPGTRPDPNAPGWNAFFEALQGEFRTYATAPTDNDQLISLNRLYQMSAALRGTNWAPAAKVRVALRDWLRPRVRLAWAERQLVEKVQGLSATASPAVRENRERWIRFVDDELGLALRKYDAAGTVPQRQSALKQVHAALTALQSKNQARNWVPSVALQTAVNDLYNQPNLDISADVNTLAQVLSANIVTSGPIYRKGYVSQVTAGPKTGFGLLPSNDGIAFFNSQMMSSITPITDFQQQMASDRKGRKAAKLYQFNVASTDTAELTIIAVLRDTGLSLAPMYKHNVNALIGSLPQAGGGLGRLIAGLVGMNQGRITQKVYEGAIGKIQQNVVKEAAELGAERTAQAAAEKNSQLAQYLIGNDSLAVRNLMISGLSLRSRPENALVGGTLSWRGATEQVGADFPQPPQLAIPAPGVSADIHLSSILTSLSRGYLQSDAVRSLDNLMIVTHKIAPDAPPAQAMKVTRNADFATFLKAVGESRAANDPKVLAIRVKRPGRSPEFAADARGFLVALVHDFVIDVPAPAQAAKGGFSGPPAQIYRITAPEAEFVISFKITAQSQKEPIRLAGRIESFDPGPGARVLAINEDESRAAPLSKFTSTFALGVFSSKLKGQPVDAALSDVQLRGFAISQVSPLDPTGWMRVVLVRTADARLARRP